LTALGLLGALKKAMHWSNLRPLLAKYNCLNIQTADRELQKNVEKSQQLKKLIHCHL
jgi:hypothetical protein